MSDHEATTTEAPANDTPERVDQQVQIAELEDAWRRTAAELDNFRKRCARDVARSREQERAARPVPPRDRARRGGADLKRPQARYE